MATILEVIECLNQIAANSYDSYLPEEKIGLKREDGHPLLDKRIIDGFRVRFAGPNMIVSYESEMRLEDLHPRNRFENEIEAKFGDIVKFLKKEYKKIKHNSVTLSEVADADILVQSTSRIHTWVQAHKQYKIGGLEGVDSVRSPENPDTPYEKRFKDFLALSSDKRPSNDKAPKNPDTPEA